MSILSHVSLGVKDVTASAKFYDAVLALFGAKRQKEVQRTFVVGLR